MHAKRTITLEYGPVKKKMSFTPGTDEQFVVKEVLIDECYAFDFKRGDSVLNLGGHIGAFDVYAFDRVHDIVTFEPNPESCALIREHLAANGAVNVTLNEAAVSNYTGDAYFKATPKRGHNRISGSDEREPTDIKVNCYSLADVFKTTKFTKVKCDIEGGEYAAFIGTAIPESVNEMWFETHASTPELRAKHDELLAWIDGQGFRHEVFKNDELDRTFLVKFVR